MLGISVLDHPEFFAGERIERNDKTVEGMSDDLPLGVVQTAIDGVAASARDSQLVAVGLLHIVPDRLWLIRIG